MECNNCYKKENIVMKQVIGEKENSPRKLKHEYLN
jgi:hypothetical protein